jgi:hypothetical protein
MDVKKMQTLWAMDEDNDIGSATHARAKAMHCQQQRKS